MSATLLRASTRSLRPLCRSVATSASTMPPPALSDSLPQEASEQPSSPSASRRSHATLSADKMRALISLYHQSENFITPDNLSHAIDAAFIEHPSYRDTVETTYSDLEWVVKSQKRKPRVGTNVNLNSKDRSKHAEIMARSLETLWSQQRPQREFEVMNALFGTHAGFKPGLETVEDEYDRIEERLKEKDGY